MLGSAQVASLLVLWLVFSDAVSIRVWSGESWFGLLNDGPWNLPNYLGTTLTQEKSDCSYLSSGEADVVLNSVLSLPKKRANETWILFSYEQEDYFPVLEHPAIARLFDAKMSYQQSSEVFVTFHCNWAGWTPSLDSLRQSPPRKPRDFFFMASNCYRGGAFNRTLYVEELLRTLPIDWFGACLNNQGPLPVPYPPDFHYHGRAMAYKMNLMQEYQFVLAFENNNKTDYVTEKLMQAFQVGAIPVYMGAPNVEQWIPPNSIIRADQFSSPTALAAYLNELKQNEAEMEKFHRWRQEPFGPAFTHKWENCLFVRGATSLCQWAKRRAGQPSLRLPSYRLSGGEFLTGNRAVSLFTFGLWVKPQSGGVLLDYAGVVISLWEVQSRYFLQVNHSGSSSAGFRPIFPDRWTYIRVVLTEHQVEGFVDFSPDWTHLMFPSVRLKKEQGYFIGCSREQTHCIRAFVDQPSFYEGDPYKAALDESLAESVQSPEHIRQYDDFERPIRDSSTC